MERGIDVANHQREVDWYAVRQSGVTFAFAKASEGVSFKDVWFARNREQAKRVGIRFGAYHFARPSNNNPIREADAYLAMIGDPAGDMLCLDIEDENAKGSQADWALAWMQRVEQRTSITPYLYTYASWWRSYGSTDPAFRKYPLWLAAYQTASPTPPKPWLAWSIWQYTSSGNQPGVNGRCDLNYGAAVTPAPTEEDIVYRTVVQATPAGTLATYDNPFTGRQPLPFVKLVGLPIPSRRAAVWAVEAVDGSGQAVVYADPATDVVVSFT